MSEATAEPVTVDTVSTTTPEKKKRGRQATIVKEQTDIRMVAVPVWVSDQVRKLAEGLDEKEKWFWTAAMTLLAQKSDEEKLELTKQAKLMNKQVFDQQPTK